MRRLPECSKQRLVFEWASRKHSSSTLFKTSAAPFLPPQPSGNKILHLLNSRSPWIYYYKWFCDLEHINCSLLWFACLRTGDDKGTHHLGLLQRLKEIIEVKNLAQCLVHSEWIIYGSFYSRLLGFISYPCYESLDDSGETQTLLTLFMSFTYLFSWCQLLLEQWPLFSILISKGWEEAKIILTCNVFEVTTTFWLQRKA